MVIKKIINRIKAEKAKSSYQAELAQVRDILNKGERPIYHVHVRKTAGTSINFAFLSNAKATNTQEFYRSLALKANQRKIKNNKVFVGWNVKLINEGDFSYAFSHTPFHQLNLPSHVRTFTCLRDPAKRVISHYNMLRYFQLNEVAHPCMKVEGNWLGNSFDDFLDRIPKEHLMNQLYMFSESMNVEDALNNLRSLDKIIYTEQLDRGLLELEKFTQWKLPVSNQKKYSHKEDITAEQLEKLKKLLAAEYQLMELLAKEHLTS